MTGGQPTWQQRLLAAGLAATAGLVVAACATSEPNPVGQGAAATLPARPVASGADVRSAPPLDAPLTGMPVASQADAARRAVALVLGRDPRGLGLADVIFQEVSNPVRYIAVFQSHWVSGVGPITSTQPTDAEAVSVLHAVIGYDGGTPGFIKVLDKAPVTDMGFATHPSLYTTTSQGVSTSTRKVLHAIRGDGAPPALFRYRGMSFGDGPLAHAGCPGRPPREWPFRATALSRGPSTLTLTGGPLSAEARRFRPPTSSWKPSPTRSSSTTVLLSPVPG